MAGYQTGKKMKMPKRPKKKPISFGKKLGGGTSKSIKQLRAEQRKILESMD